MQPVLSPSDLLHARRTSDSAAGARTEHYAPRPDVIDMYAQTAMNHRLGRRIPLNALVELRTPDGRRVDGYLRDVSASGALVWTSAKIALLTPLTIEAVESGERFEARVTRSGRCAVGVEWISPDTRTLCLLLARHDAALPKARPPALAAASRPAMTVTPDGSILLLAGPPPGVL